MPASIAARVSAATPARSGAFLQHQRAEPAHAARNDCGERAGPRQSSSAATISDPRYCRAARARDRSREVDLRLTLARIELGGNDELAARERRRPRQHGAAALGEQVAAARLSRREPCRSGPDTRTPAAAPSAASRATCRCFPEPPRRRDAGARRCPLTGAPAAARAVDASPGRRRSPMQHIDAMAQVGITLRRVPRARGRAR